MNAPAESSVWHRALRGAFEGSVGGGLGCLLVHLTSQGGPSNKVETMQELWMWLLVFVPGGGLMLAIGRAIADSIVGVLIGSTVGLLLALAIGPSMPGSYETTRTIKLNGTDMEVKGPTLDGKVLDLKDYHGKVVLIDYWATWCPPCVAGIPEVKRLYEKHHKEGFEVIGVSLDRERGDLTKFVKEKELPWPQVFYAKENAAGKNPLTERYWISGIPALFLVHRNGKVVASGRSAKDLEDVVEALLRTPDTADAVTQPASVHVGLILTTFFGCILGGIGAACAQRYFTAPQPPRGHR